MDNFGYELNGLSIFNVNPIDEEILNSTVIVKTFGNQSIDGDKTFNGTVTIENEIIHNSTSFSTKDGIIEQLRDNTADMLDYGNYAVYNDGFGTKYKGFINKKQTDKFYIFHNQTNKPVASLNLGTQELGTIVIRDPISSDEAATKAYVDAGAHGGNFLPLNGSLPMTGNLTFANDLDILHLRNIKFSDNFIYNALYFPNNNRLAITSYNSDDSVDQFMLFNNVPGQNHIEVMKNVQQHGNIEMKNSKTIKDLPNPVLGGDASNKTYTDSKLSLSGGTLSGNINMGNNDILNVDHLSINSGVIIEADSNDISYFRPFGSGVNSQIIAFTNSARSTTTMSIRGQEKLMDLHTNKIINLGNGVGPKDATNKEQLDQKLSLSGGIMSGDIIMSSSPGTNSRAIMFQNNNRILTISNNDLVMYRDNDHYIAVGGSGPYVGSNFNLQNNNLINVAPATSGLHAVNKNQLDDGLNTRLAIVGGTLFGQLNMNNNRLRGLPTSDPLLATEAISKGYFDTVINNLPSSSKFYEAKQSPGLNTIPDLMRTFIFQIPVSASQRNFIVDGYVALNFSGTTIINSTTIQINYANAAGNPVGVTQVFGPVYNNPYSLGSSNFTISMSNKKLVVVPATATQMTIGFFAGTNGGTVTKTGFCLMEVSEC